MDIALRTDNCWPWGAAQRAAAASAAGDGYELRFQSLFHAGRALAFPCDARGDVRLDALSERARQNYLSARAGVGQEYATPVVLRCA